MRIINWGVRFFNHYYELFWEQLFERLLSSFFRIRYPKRQIPPPTPSHVRSVLVWNIDSIGDAFWITPSLASLRAGYSQAKITLICSEYSKDIFEHNPHIDELIVLRTRKLYTARGMSSRFPQLVGRRFDVMLIFEMGSRPADLGRLTGRRLDVGYLVSTNLGILKTLPDYTLPPNSAESGQYWPFYFLKAIEHLQLPINERTPHLFSTKEDERHVQELKAHTFSSNIPTVLIHPCVGSYASLTKKWPLEHYTDLAVELSKKGPTRILISGSASETSECKILEKEIKTRSPNLLLTQLAGDLSIRQLYLLLKQVQLVVVADTSVLHLAAAVGVPTIALFGATNPKILTPPDPHCVVLTDEIPCRPCHSTRDQLPFWPKCIYPKPLCLERITPQRVTQEADKILSSWRQK